MTGICLSADPPAPMLCAQGDRGKSPGSGPVRRVQSDSVSGETAPRRAQTGHDSLFSLNAVPQTSQMRLPFVFTAPSSLGSYDFIRFRADRLHKMVIGCAYFEPDREARLATVVGLPAGSLRF